MAPHTAPYDALMLVSFGGPERPEDVVPFLENVTRGRGIPRDRLEEVGEHYFLFGGKSPINDQNRALIAAIEEDFRSSGVDLPVYWGNRNWDPYLADTLRQMKADGIERVDVLVAVHVGQVGAAGALDEPRGTADGVEGADRRVDPARRHRVGALEELDGAGGVGTAGAGRSHSVIVPEAPQRDESSPEARAGYRRVTWSAVAR